MLREYLSTIANAIRSKLGSTAKINAQNFADKIGEVYEKGFDEGVAQGINSGYHSGYENGLREGKQAEYDAFWDVYQQNGAYIRQEYRYSGSPWNDSNFKPKYNINCSNADHIFYGTCIVNLAEILEERGLKIDTSQATNFNYAFGGTLTTRFPEIDLSQANGTAGLFSYNNYLHTIDKLIVSENTTFTVNWFAYSSKLENVIFEGVIAKNNLKLADCPLLTKESIMSAVNCLKDYSNSGNSYLLWLGNDNLAKLTDAEKAIATQKGWTLA